LCASKERLRECNIEVICKHFAIATGSIGNQTAFT